MKEEKKEQIVKIVKYENGDMGVEMKGECSKKDMFDAFSALTVFMLSFVENKDNPIEEKESKSILAAALKGCINAAAGLC